MHGIQEVVGSIPIGSTIFLFRKNIEHWSNGRVEQGMGDNAVHWSIALLIRSSAAQKYRALEQWWEWKVEK